MQHLQKNAKVLVLLILLWTNSLLANLNEIRLPPMPLETDNSKTLLGIDANNNGVRDDVEIYIYQTISKDKDVFNAYLQFAKTEQLVLKNFPNVQKLKELDKKSHKDIYCIKVTDKNSEKNAQKFSQITSLTYNTKERAYVEKWIGYNSYEISSPMALRDIKKIKREEVCDF